MMEALDSVRTMEVLFSSWKVAQHKESDLSYLSSNIPRDMFLPDGVIDNEKFSRAPQKILFIAKEANWHQPDSNDSVTSAFWHREVAFGRTPKTQFSNRLSLLANAIMNAEKQNYTVVDKDHTVLQSVAVINLNKRGGYSYCVWNTLNTYVQKYQGFIRRQISMISPDLIVCCGYDVKWLIQEYGLAPDNVKTIWVYHPSYFSISDADYLDQLRCTMSGSRWDPSHHAAKSKNTAAPKQKGIIFDTNKTYSSGSTMDMLLSNKVSAYGDAAMLIDSFNKNDYVFFSVKGLGVVAGGMIVSDAETLSYPDTVERYKVVDFLAPAPDQIPHGEEGLRALPWRQVSELLNHKRFWHARTDKRPYLNEDESIILINALRNLYAPGEKNEYTRDNI